MSDIKAIVSFTLPGSVMYSEAECAKNPETTRKDFKIKGVEGCGIQGLRVTVRKCKPAVQKLKISEENYNRIARNTEFIPDDFIKEHKDVNRFTAIKMWKSLTPHQRFCYAMTSMKNDLGATSFHIEYID